MSALPQGGILQYQHRNSPTMLQRWIDHIESWERASQKTTILTNEELHTNFDETIARLSELLDQKVRQTRRPGLNSHSSLPWKGIIGNWKFYFTAADLDYFESQTKVHRIYAGSPGK